MEESKTKRAVLYVRVSTEEQVENYSLGSQEETCRKEAIKRGYEVAKIFKEEGRSAKTITGRPVLIQMIDYCRKKTNGVGAVFVYRLDRISRQTSDYLAIRKKLGEKDVTIISTSEPTGDSPTEKLVETILAGFAQLDNDIKSERTKNGLRARFLTGLINTKPPLGYIMHGGYVTKDPETFDTVKKTWDLMATGTKSLSEMAEIMSEWGLRFKKGGRINKISKQSAGRIFRSKFYMGIITSKRYPEEVVGQHTPMITEQQFYKVQSLLDGRTRNKEALSQYRTQENPEFPLRRIVKCGKCGAALTGGYSRGMGGRYPYYRCRKSCGGKSIKKELLENTVVNLLQRVTPSNECKEVFISFILDSWNRRRSRLQKLRTQVDGEITKLHTMRRQLVEKNLQGIYSDDIFKEQNSIIEDKLLKANITRHDETFEKYDMNKIVDFMKSMLSDLAHFYNESDLKQKKVFLSSIFPTGLLWDYNGGLNYKMRSVYQSIYTFDSSIVATGAPSGTMFEPI